MSKKNTTAPGSREDLEAKGLVPTMWQIMEEAQTSSREGEFDAIEASTSEGVADTRTATSSAKENEANG